MLEQARNREREMQSVEETNAKLLAQLEELSHAQNFDFNDDDEERDQTLVPVKGKDSYHEEEKMRDATFVQKHGQASIQREADQI